MVLWWKERSVVTCEFIGKSMSFGICIPAVCLHIMIVLIDCVDCMNLQIANAMPVSVCGVRP